MPRHEDAEIQGVPPRDAATRDHLLDPARRLALPSALEAGVVVATGLTMGLSFQRLAYFDARPYHKAVALPVVGLALATASDLSGGPAWLTRGLATGSMVSAIGVVVTSYLARRA